MDSSGRKAGEHIPTSASFSPAHTSSGNDQTKTLLIHQKSPLLITTPPQITRALAFSHPFLLPLTHLMGLLSWTSNDPWESYLLLASFWALVVYGDALIRWTGPIFMIGILLIAVYSRRYSPLSTKSFSDLSTKSETESIKHQKSLDEIVNALSVFTSRCNILAEPWLQLTDYLLTQITPTSITTKPARTNLLLRTLIITPVWIVLTIHPINIITTQRVVLVIGTVALTWHSRPARVCRNLLWRSFAIRRAAALLTGLDFISSESYTLPSLPSMESTQHENAMSVASKSNKSHGGVRFTFIVYENQRRWLGLGWTSAMLAYERAPWTDEQLNHSPPKEKFPLPKVEGGHAVWKWVPGDDWKTEKNGGLGSSDKARKETWIYYDNKVSHSRCLSIHADICSGIMDEDMMAGANTPDVESGIVMPNWSKSIPLYQWNCLVKYLDPLQLHPEIEAIQIELLEQTKATQPRIQEEAYSGNTVRRA